MSNPVVSIVRVLGDGPFAEIGRPRAVAASENLIVVGGELGWPQWNGRAVHARSDRRVGWFPVGIYDGHSAACLQLLTSTWEVNSLAIHPSGRLIAIGTGAYDGGYAFEGELLIHNLDLGRTTSVLMTGRTIEHLEWRDAESLVVVAPPATDEELDWPRIEYRAFHLVSRGWAHIEARSIDLDAQESSAIELDTADMALLHRELTRLAGRSGLAWKLRRQAWAIEADDRGVTVGLESAVERWGNDGELQWRRALDGTCTQLVPRADGAVVAAVWGEPTKDFLDRPTSIMTIDNRSGTVQDEVSPGHSAVMVGRSAGDLLVRPTKAIYPAAIWSTSGRRLGEVQLGRYDLFNHYFAVRGAADLFVLDGDEPRPWEAKYVTEVVDAPGGQWTARRLFSLAWHPGDHVYGGPGVWVADRTGRSIVHAGEVHNGAGLLPGNAFVVRRGYPNGTLHWHVGLDNQVVALDEHGGRIVAATNLGEIIVLNALDGSVLARQQRLYVAGKPVVPLSLAMASTERIWIGTLDGRVLQAEIRRSYASSSGCGPVSRRR